MNVNDVKLEDIGITGDDMLDQIFKRQLELMQKYHVIEESKGFLVPLSVPLNLHDAQGQYRLKDFAWRITEEIGEAMEALRNHPNIREHFDEEIADGLHFLTEFTILAGVTPWEVIGGYDIPNDKLRTLCLRVVPDMTYIHRYYPKIAYYVAQFIEALATTCNTFKNKPWKQSQMITDVPYFKSKLRETWAALIRIAVCAEMTPEYLFELYFKKSEVNLFRQRSNY